MKEYMHELRVKRFLAGFFIALILVLLVAFGTYASVYYHAGNAATTIVNEEITPAPGQKYTVKTVDGNLAVIPKDKPIAGLVFYPGGNVEHTAYAPLAAALADRGVLTVIVEMPLRLAVFDKDAANGIPKEFPEVTNWYIGGHSLGGAMAASYVTEHETEYKGLILLGAYSADDLSKSNLKVISIYGSEDGILNMDTYKDDLQNLPSNYAEYVIPGGCHSYFGDYGTQDGDGDATITREQQINETADYIVKNIK